MSVSIYLRNGTVYIPTSRKVPRSYYKEGEPVLLARGSDLASIADVLERALASGHPPISEEDALKQPSWVTKERTGVKSWAAFERGTLTWSLGSSAKVGTYEMHAYSANKKGQGWFPDPNPLFTLPPDTPLADVAQRAATVVYDAAGMQVKQ